MIPNRCSCSVAKTPVRMIYTNKVCVDYPIMFTNVKAGLPEDWDPGVPDKQYHCNQCGSPPKTIRSHLCISCMYAHAHGKISNLGDQRIKYFVPESVLNFISAPILMTNKFCIAWLLVPWLKRSGFFWKGCCYEFQSFRHKRLHICYDRNLQ